MEMRLNKPKRLLAIKGHHGSGYPFTPGRHASRIKSSVVSLFSHGSDFCRV